MARKHAYNQADGDLIGILDVDDIWFTEKLEKQVPYFSDPNVGIVICNTKFFNEKKSKNLYNRSVPPQGFIFDKILANYFVSLETILIRKYWLDTLPEQFDGDFNMISDFDVIVRVCSISKLKYHPEVLAGWRVHQGNDSLKRPQVFIDERERWIKKQTQNGFIDKNKYKSQIDLFISNLNRQRALYSLLNNKRITSLKYILLALRTINHKNLLLLLLILCPIPNRFLKSILKSRLNYGF